MFHLSLTFIFCLSHVILLSSPIIFCPCFTLPSHLPSFYIIYNNSPTYCLFQEDQEEVTADIEVEVEEAEEEMEDIEVEVEVEEDEVTEEEAEEMEGSVEGEAEVMEAEEVEEVEEEEAVEVVVMDDPNPGHIGMFASPFSLLS